MKKLAIILFLVLTMSAPAMAPGWRIERLYVRLTAYSPKQPREGHHNRYGEDVRNEKGIAVPDALDIPYGTLIRLPNGNVRVVDDTYPTRTARKKFKNMVMDVRYYQSIKSKPKTKAVNKEICRHFDKGWGYVEVLYDN